MTNENEATPAERPPIKRRERDAIIRSLTSGVVPGIGLQHIQVGRKEEVAALLKDIDAVMDGGAGFRIVMGPFGSGKTFFLQLLKTLCLEKKLVALQADLTPDRRMAATGGEARALYQELMQGCSTRTKAEGGALESVLQSWIVDADLGEEPTDEAVRARLRPLEDLVSGYDFAAVVAKYARAYAAADDTTKANCLRWLRAEYATKTEAREDLGVRSIIGDADIYDYLKLWARFVRMAGFRGLLVLLDEAINLYKLRSPQARERNYETILRVLNDCLQGRADGLEVVLAGTPEFLEDTRRGLYSYGALKTRLAANTFAIGELRDLSSPVLGLPSLTPEEMVVLLHNLRRVHAANCETEDHYVDDEGIHTFMDHCHRTIGAEFFRTPRDSVREFVQLLNVLEQNPEASWRELLADAPSTPAPPAPEPPADAPASSPADDDDLTTFRL